eukprot:GABV01001789.1.p2 GENE.GABV01001789.1~~GABV01001789.1.p2  ORF type:complete len:141 (+),score=47.51 GABV01001789.1:55-477(+)
MDDYDTDPDEPAAEDSGWGSDDFELVDNDDNDDGAASFGITKHPPPIGPPAASRVMPARAGIAGAARAGGAASVAGSVSSMILTDESDWEMAGDDSSSLFGDSSDEERDEEMEQMSKWNGVEVYDMDVIDAWGMQRIGSG